MAGDDDDPQEAGTAKNGARRIGRKPWTTIYATEEERAIITALAEKAGLRVSRYLVVRALRDQVVVRSDWREAVARLTEVSAHLAEISAQLENRAAPLDAVALSLRLYRVEEAALGVLTSTQKQLARAAAEIDVQALLSSADASARNVTEAES